MRSPAKQERDPRPTELPFTPGDIVESFTRGRVGHGCRELSMEIYVRPPSLRLYPVSFDHLRSWSRLPGEWRATARARYPQTLRVEWKSVAQRGGPLWAMPSCSFLYRARIGRCPLMRSVNTSVREMPKQPPAKRWN